MVLDANVVVAALVDNGPKGKWAEQLLVDDGLVAPHLMMFEVANILRRLALAGEISDDLVTLAHADLLDLRIELFTYDALASRVWDLRNNVTCYDAAYVALAEGLGCPLATLDIRLTKAPGLSCRFLTP